LLSYFFFFQAEDGIRDFHVTGVQTCALPIYILPFIRHFKRFTVISFSVAHFTRDIHIRKEMHLNLDDSVSAASFTASAFNVEARSEERRVGKECRLRWLLYR